METPHPPHPRLAKAAADDGLQVLPGTRFTRVTDTGRRLSARPRMRVEPDMHRLVQLVLHLADTLHQEAQNEG